MFRPRSPSSAVVLKMAETFCLLTSTSTRPIASQILLVSEGPVSLESPMTLWYPFLQCNTVPKLLTLIHSHTFLATDLARFK